MIVSQSPSHSPVSSPRSTRRKSQQHFAVTLSPDLSSRSHTHPTTQRHETNFNSNLNSSSKHHRHTSSTSNPNSRQHSSSSATSSPTGSATGSPEFRSASLSDEKEMANIKLLPISTSIELESLRAQLQKEQEVTLNELRESHQHQLNELQSHHTAQLSQLNSEHSHYSSHLSSLRRSLSTTTSELSTLQSSHSSLQSSFDHLKKQHRDTDHSLVITKSKLQESQEEAGRGERYKLLLKRAIVKIFREKWKRKCQLKTATDMVKKYIKHEEEREAAAHVLWAKTYSFDTTTSFIPSSLDSANLTLQHELHNWLHTSSKLLTRCSIISSPEVSAQFSTHLLDLITSLICYAYELQMKIETNDIRCRSMMQRIEEQAKIREEWKEERKGWIIKEEEEKKRRSELEKEVERLRIICKAAGISGIGGSSVTSSIGTKLTSNLPPAAVQGRSGPTVTSIDANGAPTAVATLKLPKRIAQGASSLDEMRGIIQMHTDHVENHNTALVLRSQTPAHYPVRHLNSHSHHSHPFHHPSASHHHQLQSFPPLSHQTLAVLASVSAHDTNISDLQSHQKRYIEDGRAISLSQLRSRTNHQRPQTVPEGSSRTHSGMPQQSPAVEIMPRVPLSLRSNGLNLATSSTSSLSTTQTLSLIHPSTSPSSALSSSSSAVPPSVSGLNFVSRYHSLCSSLHSTQSQLQQLESNYQRLLSLSKQIVMELRKERRQRGGNPGGSALRGREEKKKIEKWEEEIMQVEMMMLGKGERERSGTEDATSRTQASRTI